TAEMVDEARLKAELGYTAIGHLNPMLDDASSGHFRTHAASMAHAIDLVGRVREAVGNDVDLCLELHRRLSPAEAITLGRHLEPFNPLFYEDPLKPQSYDAMATVADRIPIPIATGERFFNLQQFQTLMARRGAEYLRVSVGLCGGLTGARKIAALGEAHDAQVVPHNPVGPIGLAACLQLDACIPNFAIQEFPIGTKRIDE